jgi:hypothetical protein
VRGATYAVGISAKFYQGSPKVLEEARVTLRGGGSPPKLATGSHCPVCPTLEFSYRGPTP